MCHFVNQFWNDEDGFVLSAELVIILTVAVLGVIVGLSYVQTAVVSEFTDIAGAIHSLNQNYAYTGYYARGFNGKFRAFYSGSAYNNFQPRGAVLGYNGYAYNGCNVGRGTSYSEELHLENEVVEEPCDICKPGEVLEGGIVQPEVDCPHCEVNELKREVIIPPSSDRKN